MEVIASGSGVEMLLGKDGGSASPVAVDDGGGSHEHEDKLSSSFRTLFVCSIQGLFIAAKEEGSLLESDVGTTPES